MHAEFLATRLAVMEAGGLRPLHDADASLDFPSQGWRQSANSWASDMQPGDELWSWCTPAWTWQKLRGRVGLAIVRDGQPIRFSVTMLN